MSRLPHAETHLISRIGWLRAAVLGANDGIVSTSSLIVGVASAAAVPGTVLLTGVAGLVAGAMSMAAGEYVSVSSQADTEAAELAREATELSADLEGETAELAAIYRRRGLSEDLARAVALQLMDRDALGAHAQDELGLMPGGNARPVQAALVSAATFSVGAAMPLLLAVIAPWQLLVPMVAVGSLLFLALLGVVGAHAGGAGRSRAAARVMFWGAAAMVATAVVGRLFGATV